MMKDYGKQLKRGRRLSTSSSKIRLSPFAKNRLFSVVIASLATFYSGMFAEGVAQESTLRSPGLREAPSPNSYRQSASTYEPLPELPESNVVFHSRKINLGVGKQAQRSRTLLRYRERHWLKRLTLLFLKVGRSAQWRQDATLPSLAFKRLKPCVIPRLAIRRRTSVFSISRK